MTRAVCKVRGLTLLLQVGNLWKCDDGLFFEVPPLASDALLTTLHPLLENSWSLRNFLPRSSLFIVGKAQKSHGARSELNSVFGLEKVNRWNPIRTSVIQSRARPMRFLGFSNHEKGAPRQEISKWPTVCSTFSRSGWSVVRSASLVKGVTSKMRPYCTSTKFRLGVIRQVHELSKWSSYKESVLRRLTALLFYFTSQHGKLIKQTNFLFNLTFFT
jgi:hypothetical protein